jgi:hypothetical protein
MKLKTVRLLAILLLASCAIVSCGRPDSTAGRDERDKKVTRERLSRLGQVIGDSHPLPAHYYETKTGKPGLSWRVSMLGRNLSSECSKLFMQVAFDEPWDSPQNLALLKSMPEVFRSPRGDAPEGYTYYRAFIGKHAVISPPAPPANVLASQSFAMVNGHKVIAHSGTPLFVPDGMARTIFLAEGAEPVPWTKPEELEFDSDKPLPKLGGLYPDGFFALTVNGTPVFIPSGTNEGTIRALITIDGNEEITDRAVVDQLFPKN